MLEIVSQPLPWQHAQWQRVTQQIERAQLPHAMLLAGPPGVGKRFFAQALGAILLCRAPQYGAACGQCKSCQLLAAHTHPDWHWLAPEEIGKAIKIDQVRALVEQMGQTAQQGGRKLAVMAPAEAMNRNAANALLKTLEEPTGAAQLILIGDMPGRLLPTLRSRCQRLDFPVPPRDSIRDWLQPSATSPEKLEQALDEAAGRPLLARELLEGEGFAERRELNEELAGILLRRMSVLAGAERWKQRDWIPLLYWLESRITRALRRQVVEEAELSDQTVTLLAQAPAQALFGLLDQLRTLINLTLAGTNPNAQLALESFLFAVCDAVNKKTPALRLGPAS